MADIVERLKSDGEDERQRFREARATLGPLLNEAAAEIERLWVALGHVDACIVCGQIDQARKAIRAALEGRT